MFDLYTLFNCIQCNFTPTVVFFNPTRLLLSTMNSSLDCLSAYYMLFPTQQLENNYDNNSKPNLTIKYFFFVDFFLLFIIIEIIYFFLLYIFFNYCEEE